MQEIEREEEEQETWWDVLKFRLTIALVVIVLLGLVFMMVDGSIINFQCSFWDFITFECNRWDASFKPWK